MGYAYFTSLVPKVNVMVTSLIDPKKNVELHVNQPLIRLHILEEIGEEIGPVLS